MTAKNITFEWHGSVAKETGSGFAKPSVCGRGSLQLGFATCASKRPSCNKILFEGIPMYFGINV